MSNQLALLGHHTKLLLQFHLTQTGKAEAYTDNQEQERKAGDTSSSHAARAITVLCGQIQQPTGLMDPLQISPAFTPQAFTLANTSLMSPHSLPSPPSLEPRN